jgi:hypothetical protein
MKYLKNTLYSLIILLFISIPLVSSAQNPINPGNSNTSSGGTSYTPVKIDNPFDCKGVSPCTLMTLIKTILSSIVMPIASVAIVVWIVWAGFQFVLAQGKPGDIDKAKQNLLWSLVGAGILLGAAAISAVVENTVKNLMN